MRMATMAAAAATLLAASGGCTWFDFVPGVHHGSEFEPANPAHPGDALSTTRERMQMEPKEPYWPCHLGELYAAADSTARAIPFLKAALDLDPGYAPAASLLSKIYYDAGMHAEAVALLRGALAAGRPAPDELRVALAMNLEATGEFDQASQVLAACTDDSPATREARTLVSFRTDEPQQALEAAKRALDADPHSAANQNNYGIALLYVGHPDKAREAFKAALAINDRLPGALYNMAVVETFYFFDDGAGRQWFDRYRQYASADPNDLASHFETNVSRSEPAGH
jgi:predicted Zn-dependent protease